MKPIIIKEKKFPFYKDTFLSAVISVRNKKYLKISYDDGKTKENTFMYCIHAKLYNTNLENIMATDKIQIQSEVAKMNTPKEEIILEKDENFFALCSWVEGIAENGLESLIIQKTIESDTSSLPVSGFLFNFLSKYYDEVFDIFLENIAKECKFEGEWHESSLVANIDLTLNLIRGRNKYTDLEDNDTAMRFGKIFQYGFPTEMIIKSEKMQSIIRRASEKESEVLYKFFSKEEMNDYLNAIIITTHSESINRLRLFIIDKKARGNLIFTLIIIAIVIYFILFLSITSNDIFYVVFSSIFGIFFGTFWLFVIAYANEPFPAKIACIDFENYRVIFNGRLLSTEEITASSNGKNISLKCLDIISIVNSNFLKIKISNYRVIFDRYPKIINHNGMTICGSRVTVNEFPLWLQNVFGDSFGESVTFRSPNGQEFKPFLCFAK